MKFSCHAEGLLPIWTFKWTHIFTTPSVPFGPWHTKPMLDRRPVLASDPSVSSVSRITGTRHPFYPVLHLDLAAVTEMTLIGSVPSKVTEERKRWRLWEVFPLGRQRPCVCKVGCPLVVVVVCSSATYCYRYRRHHSWPLSVLVLWCILGVSGPLKSAVKQIALCKN